MALWSASQCMTCDRTRDLMKQVLRKLEALEYSVATVHHCAVCSHNEQSHRLEYIQTIGGQSEPSSKPSPDRCVQRRRRRDTDKNIDSDPSTTVATTCSASSSHPSLLETHLGSHHGSGLPVASSKRDSQTSTSSTPCITPDSFTQLSLSRHATAADSVRSSTPASESLKCIPSRDEHSIYKDAVSLGIIYVPDTDEIDTNRTVHLSGLPAGSDFRSIMHWVRGGMIVSATMHDMGWLDGTFTIRLIFLKEESAKAFVSYFDKHAASFPADLAQSETPIKAALISSPTYPLCDFLFDAIHRCKRTRMLRIQKLSLNMHPDTLIEMLADPGTKRSGVLWLDIDQNQRVGDTYSVTVEFGSVLSAISAFERVTQSLRTHVWFASCCVSFAPDPCDRPLPTTDIDCHEDSQSTEELLIEL